MISFYVVKTMIPLTSFYNDTCRQQTSISDNSKRNFQECSSLSNIVLIDTSSITQRCLLHTCLVAKAINVLFISQQFLFIFVSLTKCCLLCCDIFVCSTNLLLTRHDFLLSPTFHFHLKMVSFYCWLLIQYLFQCHYSVNINQSWLLS